MFPKKIRKKVIDLFEDYDKKVVMDFGAGAGPLTMMLADKVGEYGRIFSVDLSVENLKIVEKRAKKRGHVHVTTVHDKHLVNRVDPRVPKVDMIFSVGMLSYLQDMKKILGEMYGRLPDGGQICFVEYTKMYKVMPDLYWLAHDKEIRKIFKKAGFSINIKREKGILWDYLIIYGIKSFEEVPFA